METRENGLPLRVLDLKAWMKIPFVHSNGDRISISDPIWSGIPEQLIGTDWKGDICETSRHFYFQLGWNERFLFARFRTKRNAECVISATPDLTTKTLGLWDRDVCEIFVAPALETPKEYFEFEIAPTGEWVDLGLRFEDGKRITDTRYVSNSLFETEIHGDEDLMMIAIPWESVGFTPSSGKSIKGNVFRCTGSEPGRGYLALWPTRSEYPNFHVPEAFGEFTLSD